MPRPDFPRTVLEFQRRFRPTRRALNASLKREGYHHEARVEGKPKRAPEILPHIHLIFSNLKMWLM